MTVGKWKNHDVIPKRYAANLFFLINHVFEPNSANAWKRAFETVWAQHAVRARAKTNIENRNTAEIADDILSGHRNWIERLHREPVWDESFSIQDIFVPLQLVEEKNENYQVIDFENLISAATLGWGDQSHVSWTLISGPPGSGKSTLAIQLAQSLSEQDIFQVFIRGRHAASGDFHTSRRVQFISDSYSIQAFIQQFRLSSKGSACLIFDGLDQVAIPDDLISNLKSQQEICEMEGKTLRVFILGRDSQITRACELLSNPKSKCLKILSLSGAIRQPKSRTSLQVGEDLRPVWWENFLASKGLPPCENTPDFLSNDYDEFSEFGQDPLLSYLLCRIKFPPNGEKPTTPPSDIQINEFTYSQNKGEVIRTIIDQIPNSALRRPEFNDLMQQVALINWHSTNTHTPTTGQIKPYIENIITQGAFEAFGQTATRTKNGSSLKPAYFKMSALGDTPDEENLVFVHPSFSHYFLSTLIFDRFEELLRSLSNPKKFGAVFQKWLDLCAAGDESAELADFCESEAAMRFPAINKLDWNAALTLLKSKTIDSENSTNFTLGSNPIGQIKRARSLLFLVWASLNKQRFNTSTHHFPLFQTDNGLQPEDVKIFQPQMTVHVPNSQQLGIISPNWLGHSLSGVKLMSTNMSDLQFRTGHIKNLLAFKTSFSRTHWSFVKVSDATFNQGNFQQASFEKTRFNQTVVKQCLFRLCTINNTSFKAGQISNTRFAQCHFVDVDFTGCHFKDVTFDGCIFVGESFLNPFPEIQLRDASFKNCSFVNLKNLVERASPNVVKDKNRKS